MSIIGKALERVENKPPVPYTTRRAQTVVGGGMTRRSGNMTEQLGVTAGNGTIFSIVDRLATMTASLEWGLYRQSDDVEQEDEERERITKHAAWDLWSKPNEFYTRYELVETVQQHLDLVGEGWLVVVRGLGIPVEIWPVRPDRMAPVPHATKYLAGYEYTTPDGDKIPLKLDEVIFMRRPNPLDPYRGMGPVQAVLADIDSAKYSAEWNRNFFLNSAEPGGIIEVERRLSDDEWDEMVQRWNEQHRGVSRAHRVAMIEHGKYVPRAFSMRDMQFAELRNVSRDVFMEAYGASKPMLGITDDVNRANAEASIFASSKWLGVPRADRWSQALNFRLLPMFGATGKGVEFDYVSPVDEDVETANSERDSKVRAVAALVPIGFKPKETLEAFGLPDIPFEKPEPPPQLAPGDPNGPNADPNDPNADPNADPAKQDEEGDEGDEEGEQAPPKSKPKSKPKDFRAEVSEEDLSELQEAYERTLERLLDQWGPISVEQRAALQRQVEAALEAGDLAQLAQLTAPVDTAAARLHEAMIAYARLAAAQAARWAVEQGAEGVTPAEPSESLADVALSAASLLAAGLALSAGREALHRWHEDAEPAEVARQVREHLDELADAGLKSTLGGALTGAGNRARIDTFKSGPVGSLYATEKLDSSTCDNCRAIDGRFLCTTEDISVIDKLYTPFGGYVECEGGIRCRGSVTGVWRPERTKR